MFVSKKSKKFADKMIHNFFLCSFSKYFWYPAVMANVNERENLNEFTLAACFLEKRR